MGLGQAPQQVDDSDRDCLGGRGAGAAEHHQPAAAVAQRQHIVAGAVEMSFNPACMLDQRFAENGGTQAPRVALEERQANVFFQFPDPFG